MRFTSDRQRKAAFANMNRVMFSESPDGLIKPVDIKQVGSIYSKGSEIKKLLLDLVHAKRIGREDLSDIGKKLDDLDVPMYVQNNVAYLAETTNKYGNEIVSNTLQDLIDMELDERSASRNATIGEEMSEDRRSIYLRDRHPLRLVNVQNIKKQDLPEEDITFDSDVPSDDSDREILTTNEADRIYSGFHDFVTTNVDTSDDVVLGLDIFMDYSIKTGFPLDKVLVVNDNIMFPVSEDVSIARKRARTRVRDISD